MTTRRKIVAAGLFAAAFMGSTALPAEPAAAVVLVQTPQSDLSVGQSIKVGVFYASFDGGPRGYRVRVSDPNGNTAFQRSGSAPSHWRYWRVNTNQPGQWNTVYLTKSKGGGWMRTVFTTSVHR